MALQNRVTPFGTIVATNPRGTMMGNRGGRIHVSATQKLTARRWASKRWICCQISFRGRNRTVMGPGYTELFFLDEVTALAAGHRPCFECRRADARRFAELWHREFGFDSGSRADQMDRQMHQERTFAVDQRTMIDNPSTLPNGAMIVCQGRPFAILEGQKLEWTASGYRDIAELGIGGARLLTPPSIVAILKSGYQPHWHPSAW